MVEYVNTLRIGIAAAISLNVFSRIQTADLSSPLNLVSISAVQGVMAL